MKKNMSIFGRLRAKTYNYLIGDGSEEGTKKCVIQRKLIFQNYKNCLEATQFDDKINYLGKNEIDIDRIFKKWRIYKKQ